MINRHRDILSHDESNSVQVGDTVRIEHCRPLSASKRFAVCEVLAKSKYPAPPGLSRAFFAPPPVPVEDGNVKDKTVTMRTVIGDEPRNE